MKRKKIIKELNQLLIKNKKFISDFWLYGSIDDELSDLDIICLYKKKPIQIRFSKFLRQKIDDGTIIFVQEKKSKNIFLFEKLDIFSIKYGKKIIEKISPNIKPLRYLTSFLERYYERRALLGKIKNITPRTLRLIKSTIFSYQSFLKFCKNKKIKLTHNLFNFNEYRIVRKKYLSNKLNDIYFEKYLKKFKLRDNIFYNQSLFILDNYYKFNRSYYLSYNFNKYTKYSFKKSKNCIIVPKILAYIYKIYSSENVLLSKKIKKDFNSDIKIDNNHNILNNYLKIKLGFLNSTYKDLKKQKFKSGLYRLSWYLN
tara:strand:+ start:6916 stop:7854 length:939 start_codon:yes stop_codon:yes gene_type:complete